MTRTIPPGRHLKARRVLLGLPHEVVAQALGIDRSEVSRMENGYKPFRDEWREPLIKVLQWSLEDLRCIGLEGDQ
jgi:transcriptional regulator with XRE-family HTH domain